MFALLAYFAKSDSLSYTIFSNCRVGHLKAERERDRECTRACVRARVCVDTACFLCKVRQVHS